MSRVLIIGSGMAGVAAAIEAGHGGAEVTLIAGRPGATALSSGAVDFGDSAAEKNPHEEFFKNLPLALSPSAVSSGPNCHAEGSGGSDQKFKLITSLGTIRTATLIQESMAEGNVAEINGGRVGIVEIRGLNGYPSSLIVKNLLAGEVIDAEAIELKLSVFGRPPFSPFAIAAELDNLNIREKFVEAVANITKDRGLSHLIFPPVLGITKTGEILSALNNATNKRCAEMPSVVPSVPGLRLDNALKALLVKSGINLRDGRVVEVRSNGRKIERVKVERQGSCEMMNVDRCLLATGKYVGGGIIKEGIFKEPLFGLPVFCKGVCVEKTFVGKLVVREEFLASHDLMTVGVRVDERFQPVNEWGELIFENLFAAGSVLTGHHFSHGKEGLGVALKTGTQAGRMAVS